MEGEGVKEPLDYEKRKFLYYNRANDWRPGQQIVLFYFDSRVPQSIEYLNQFVQLAIVEEQNYYAFITQEVNSLDMHILDVMPDLLKFNIINDDGSFLQWLNLKAVPVVLFYSGIGRYEGEFHPSNNKVRGRLASNNTNAQSEFIKRQLEIAKSSKDNIIHHILKAQHRDDVFKNKYKDFELNDISDLYQPKHISKMHPYFHNVKRKDFFFIDDVSRKFLNINFQVFPSARKIHRKFMQGKVGFQDTFQFQFQSDLSQKNDQITPLKRDVIQPHIYRPKEIQNDTIMARNSQIFQ